MKESLEFNLMRRFAIGDILYRTSKRYPNKEALIFKEMRITYDEFNNKVNRFANSLKKLGIKKGDRVAILSHNCPQFAIFLFSLAKLGAWANPLNFMLKGEEIVYILNNSKAIAFFVEDKLVKNVNNIKNKIPHVKHFAFIKITDNAVYDTNFQNDWINFDDLCSDNFSDQEPYTEISGDDVCTLMYTSGTEALPKGVMITHLNWYGALLSSFSCPLHRHDDVISADIPLYHIACMDELFTGVAIGAKIVIHYDVNIQDILKDIQKENITYIFYPSTFYLGLLQLQIENLDDYLNNIFTSLKTCISFGPNIPEPIAIRWMKKIVPHATWYNCYGQTELTSVGTWLVGEDILKNYKNIHLGGPIGKPAITVEMKIVNDNEKEVKIGEVGEIIARTPTAMAGYYKDELKTEKTFHNGWIHTGDLGVMDEEGFFYFVDRKKDIIKTGGENVSSLEVELYISNYFKVAEVAVFGISDPYWGEAVTAVVVPRDTFTLSEIEIIDFCKESLAGYKVPKKVFISDEIPKNPSGKILKRELRNIYMKQK
ncbi:AMP-binding protein [Thermodesulfobacteriota bacterium]